MALGELINEETGTVTGVRVLPATAEGANYEVCLRAEGHLRGTSYVTNWTYIQLERTDGTIQGHGDGVCKTECGQTLYLKGAGCAKAVTADGIVRYRVINHWHTKSEKFADLNGSAMVGEYDVNPDGTTIAKMWILE